jgi:hypothetical protein
MTCTQFYGYQSLWFVFATLVSFIAALLFWTKGAAAIGGKFAQFGETTWKLGGAASIFVIVMLLFYVIDPLKDLSDYKRVLVVYSTDRKAPEAGGANEQFTITPDQIKDASILDFDKVVLEMIPLDSVESLLLGLDGKSFKTAHPLAVGMYRFRIMQRDSGHVLTERAIEVPPSAAK